MLASAGFGFGCLCFDSCGAFGVFLSWCQSCLVESLFLLESSRPEFDQSLALAGALDHSDSHTDPKKEIPQTIVFYTFNLKSSFLKFVESIQLRICIWDIVESPRP